MSDAALTDLIRRIDQLEGRASAYLRLDEVERALPTASTALREAMSANVLLVDHRTRVDAASGRFEAVTLCRLNRHHPLVKRLTGWDAEVLPDNQPNVD